MAKKHKKRQKKSKENKIKIVNCAMRLFAQHGYDNVSVDDIARLANSSKGSFYNYFDSKDEVFKYYRQELNNEYTDFYEQLLNDPLYKNYNGLQKFYLMCIFILHTMTANDEEFARISDMRLLRDRVDVNEEINARDNFHIIMPQLIDMGKTDGSIKEDLSTCEIMSILRFYINGIMYDWEVSKGSYYIVEKFSYMLEFFSHSIAKYSD